MSKSLKRVTADARVRGLDIEIVKMTVSTRTAQEAAEALGADVAQIAKSVIFRGMKSDTALLYVTAGSNRVDMDKAAALAGEPLGKADAAFIRETTGFAIGGVSPLGHVTPSRTWMDETLMSLPTLWAAAGTPHHMFEIVPEELADAIGADVAAFVEF